MDMNRDFGSMRQDVNQIADHWARASRYLREEDRKYGEKLAKLAKMYSREAFISCDDPLEAVIFSVLVEMLKRQENRGNSSEILHPKDGVLSWKYWT